MAFYDGSFAQTFHEAEPSAYSEWMSFLQKHQTLTRRLISYLHYLIRQCDVESPTKSISSVNIKSNKDQSNSEQKIILFASVPLSDESLVRKKTK